jgi:1-acyl-sn-glycerol-3-phosphate acyltransferase
MPPTEPARARLLLTRSAAIWRGLYALYACGLFVLLGTSALLATILLPGLQRRRAATRTAARCLLRLAGLRASAHFLERLPAEQCVVVCNHASYLDGVVCMALLPARFRFVIKREMGTVPLAGLLLRRIGSEFVERFDPRRGARDARRVLRSAASGDSLAFFPEGTFARTPGVLKFHVGAFVTAVRVGCPVVPAVLRGTRAALPPGAWLPRPANVSLTVLPPLGSAGLKAAELRDVSRARILAELGEPDLELTCCDDIARPPDTARVRSARASRP